MLNLVKDINDSKRTIHSDKNAIQTELFKNTIKKDLEVSMFQHKACRVFGEFQIYSNIRSELSSFDLIVSFLVGKSFEYTSEEIEAKVACRCPEHFLNLIITKSYNFNDSELNQLATKYTNYIIESSEIIKNEPFVEAHQKIIDLDKKYFGGNDPTAISKYLNPKMLMN